MSTSIHPLRIACYGLIIGISIVLFSLYTFYIIHRCLLSSIRQNRNSSQVFGKDVYLVIEYKELTLYSMQIFVPIAPSHPGLDCDRLQGNDKSMLKEYTEVLFNLILTNAVTYFVLRYIIQNRLQ